MINGSVHFILSQSILWENSFKPKNPLLRFGNVLSSCHQLTIPGTRTHTHTHTNVSPLSYNLNGKILFIKSFFVLFCFGKDHFFHGLNAHMKTLYPPSPKKKIKVKPFERIESKWCDAQLSVRVPVCVCFFLGRHTRSQREYISLCSLWSHWSAALKY